MTVERYFESVILGGPEWPFVPFEVDPDEAVERLHVPLSAYSRAACSEMGEHFFVPIEVAFEVIAGSVT
jgi:hypothetical protein